MAPAKVKVVTERPQSDSFKQVLLCFWRFVSVDFVHDLNSLTAHLISSSSLLFWTGVKTFHFPVLVYRDLCLCFVMDTTMLVLEPFYLGAISKTSKSPQIGKELYVLYTWRQLEGILVPVLYLDEPHQSVGSAQSKPVWPPFTNQNTDSTPGQKKYNWRPFIWV